MPDDFDPYNEWLEIPPEEQPPNHYRLLGIKLLENDTQVIADAALKATALLRQYQLSSKADYSQRLLGEVAFAKACLADPERKREYDLQQKAVGNATGVADRHSNSNILKDKGLDALRDQLDEWLDEEDPAPQSHFYQSINSRKHSDKQAKTGEIENIQQEKRKLIDNLQAMIDKECLQEINESKSDSVIAGAIDVCCKHCKYDFIVDKSNAGKIGRCPSCLSVVHVPEQTVLKNVPPKNKVPANLLMKILRFIDYPSIDR